MHLEERSFWRSTFVKVIWITDRWANEEKMKADAMSGKPVRVPEVKGTARSVKEVMALYGKQ